MNNLKRHVNGISGLKLNILGSFIVILIISINYYSPSFPFNDPWANAVIFFLLILAFNPFTTFIFDYHFRPVNLSKDFNTYYLATGIYSLIYITVATFFLSENIREGFKDYFYTIMLVFMPFLMQIILVMNLRKWNTGRLFSIIVLLGLPLIFFGITLQLFKSAFVILGPVVS